VRFPARKQVPVPRERKRDGSPPVRDGLSGTDASQEPPRRKKKKGKGGNASERRWRAHPPEHFLEAHSRKKKKAGASCTGTFGRSKSSGLTGLSGGRGCSKPGSPSFQVRGGGHPAGIKGVSRAFEELLLHDGRASRPLHGFPMIALLESRR